ncbi:MAG: DOMON domain-containing protein [Bacteroidota bacterium]
MRGIKTICFMALCYLLSAGLYGQQSITIQGMSFTYRVDQDLLHCTVEAATKGWVGVGFNAKNSIVGSDLYLFQVVNNKATGVDLYVKGVGNPVKDVALGGQSSFKILNATEVGNTTTVEFTVPLHSKDPYDFVHKMEEEYWIILAYSVADDFGHHSRLRKHFPFTLEVTH